MEAIGEFVVEASWYTALYAAGHARSFACSLLVRSFLSAALTLPSSLPEHTVRL